MDSTSSYCFWFCALLRATICDMLSPLITTASVSKAEGNIESVLLSNKSHQSEKCKSLTVILSNVQSGWSEGLREEDKSSKRGA